MNWLTEALLYGIVAYACIAVVAILFVVAICRAADRGDELAEQSRQDVLVRSWEGSD